MTESRDIVKQPLVTEKTMLAAAEGKYTFVVDERANKYQIRESVEDIFDVEVLKVNTMRMQGKVRRMGVHEGRRPSWKKAIITLAPGDEIDFFEGMM